MPATMHEVPERSMCFDDTSVAVLETRSVASIPRISPQVHLHFHKKITANNSAHTGIHPSVAHISHQENLATLINEAIPHLPSRGRNHYNGLNAKPDFITVTRGPGMRSSLNTGLDTAKGLAVAWQIPILGVNHMQAHALTPRLVSALDTAAHTALPRQQYASSPTPRFPFLTLLVSGGHTLLVHSQGLSNHAILASTTDIAIGDCIDKMARTILPPSLLRSSGEIMYGRLLERFAFPNGCPEHHYSAPSTRAEEIEDRVSQNWGWSLPVPLAEQGKSRAAEFTFAGFGSHVRRICLANPNMTHEERRDLAREAMRIVFEHLAMRTVWALQALNQQGQRIDTLVISGGVASNGFLRQVLQRWLACKTGFGEGAVKINAPPVELCTDNAAMIAWCGMEMWRAGWESELTIKAFRKWSVDPRVEGGILGVEGWKRRHGVDEEDEDEEEGEDEAGGRGGGRTGKEKEKEKEKVESEAMTASSLAV